MFITYADFLRLPLKKQRIVVEMIQDFVVEYERVQNYKLKEDLERQRKYQVYKQILEFVTISSAHAFPLDANENVCLYAGNRSRMSGGKCSKPTTPETGRPRNGDTYLTYDMENDRFYNGTYLDNPQQGCKSNTHIVCNEEIFGQIGNSKLCVKTSDDIGESASLQCARAVRSIRESSEANREINLVEGSTELQLAEGEDAHCALLDSVVDRMSTDAGTNAVNALYMMADVCLCGKNATSNPTPPTFSAHPETPSQSGNTYADFAELMFGNATCLGLLLQIDNLQKYTGNENSCYENPGGTNDSALAQWLSIQEQISRLITGSVSEELASTNEVAIGLALPPMGDMSEPEYQQAIRDAVTARYEGVANQRFEEAVSRNLCPITSESYGFEITLNEDGVTATGQVTVANGLPELTETQLQATSVTTPDRGSITAVNATNQQITITLTELGQSGGTFTACLGVAGFACSDLDVPNSAALPLEVTVLEGLPPKLKVEYNCEDDCSDATEFTAPSLTTDSANLNGFAIVGEFSPDNCPADEESQAQPSIFCAEYTPPSQETEVSLSGESTNPIKNYAGSTTIPGSNSASLSFGEIANIIRIEGGEAPKLAVRVGTATFSSGVSGEDPVDLLAADANLGLMAIEVGTTTGLSFNRVEGNEGPVFLPKSNREEETFNVSYNNGAASGSFTAPGLGASCEVALSGNRATVTLNLPDSLQVPEGTDLLISPASTTLTLQREGGDTETKDLTKVTEGETQPNQVVYTLEGDESFGESQASGVSGFTLNISNLSAADKALTCGNLPDDLPDTGGTGNGDDDGDTETDLASVGECRINVGTQELVQGQYQATFRLQVSASGIQNSEDGEEAEENSDDDYTVKIFDLTREESNDEDEEDEPEEDRRVIQDRAVSSEEEGEVPAGAIEESIRDSVEETSGKRVLSSTGNAAIPTRRNRVPVRVVAYKNGVPCATQNIEIPESPIAYDTFQGDATPNFVPGLQQGLHQNQRH